MLLLQETEPNTKKLNPKRAQGRAHRMESSRVWGPGTRHIVGKTHTLCLSVCLSGFILQTSIFIHTVSLRTMITDKSRLTFSSFASSGEALSSSHNNPIKTTNADRPFLNPCLCLELITVSRDQATITGSSWIESLQAVAGLMILVDTLPEVHSER